VKVTEGVVVKAGMTKAVVVRVERLVQHKQYKKYILRRTKMKARDELKCREGDVVAIVPTRPQSRDIRWRIVKILGRRSLSGEPEEVPTA
jgi:small subunit ribosomal protein S17